MHTHFDPQDASGFVQNYFAQLNALLRSVELAEVQRFMDVLLATRERGGTVFIIGNGGSAATAAHMANDFGAVAFKRTDAVRPLRALSLADNMAFLTAIGNDDGYDQVFVRQLIVHYRPSDVLIAISASGNSPNAVAAAKWVREQGGVVVGMLGFDGGTLAGLCDIAIVAKADKGEYGLVEDVHMILDHVLTTWLQRL